MTNTLPARFRAIDRALHIDRNPTEAAAAIDATAAVIATIPRASARDAWTENLDGRRFELRILLRKIARAA